MSMDVRKVKLDFNRTFQNDIPSVQGDTGRSIEFQIMNGSLAEDITGETVKIFGLKPDGFRVFNNATITDAPNGKCVVDLTPQMLCVAGIVQCTLVRYKSGEKLSSRKFKIEVAESVADDLEIESTNEYLTLTEALNVTKDNLNNAVETKVNQMLADGDLANMTIQDASITKDKISPETLKELKTDCANSLVNDKNLYNSLDKRIIDNRKVSNSVIVTVQDGSKAVRIELPRGYIYMLYNIFGEILVKNHNGDVLYSKNVNEYYKGVPIILNKDTTEDTAILWFNYSETSGQSIYKVNEGTENTITPILEPFFEKEEYKERTNNLFDKNRVFYGAWIENSAADISGTTQDAMWIGNIVEVNSSDIIYSNQLIRCLFFDSSMKAIRKKSIKAGDNYDLSTITEGTPAYMLIGCDDKSTDPDTLMVSKSPIAAYEPYYKNTNSVKINQYYIEDYKTDSNTYDDAILEIFSKIRANKATVNSGAEVIFSESVYELSPRVLPQRTKFVGQGIGITVLKAKDGVTGDFITVADTSKFSGIKGMTIWGNKDNANVNGLVFKMNGYPTHDYTEVYDKTNTNATTYFYGRYEDILVTDCKGDGINIGFGFYLLSFINVYTYGCDGYGIYDKGTDNFFSNIVTERSGKSGIFENGGNNKWCNVKSIWNGKITVDGEAGVKIKDTMRTQMSNVECQDNYCNGYHLENVQGVNITNGLADGNGRILGAANVEGFVGNPDCMGLYIKGVSASKIDMHFDNYKNSIKYQNKAYFIDGSGTYDNQYNFTELRQNVPMVLKQQYGQVITCSESDVPQPAAMYRGKTILYYSESEGRDKVCVCVKKNSTEYEWKEI